MKSISCAFIASYYGPYYSNFVASMLAFEEKMKQRGHYTIYILPQETEEFFWVQELKKRGFKMYFIPYLPSNFKNVKQLRKIFKSEKINLIYSHMCGWDFTVRFAAPFTKTIWHMHMGVNLDTWLRKIKNWIKFRILASKKVYHIAASASVSDVIQSLHPANDCVAIPNALDFNRLDIVKNYNKNKPVKLLLFGWAPIVKGLDITLTACEQLNQDECQVTLTVSAQENTYSYIESRYGEKLPEWLTLVGPTDNVSRLYNNADCLVSASISEGFSYCLAEAIYCGLPFVYSNICGTAWADELRCGYKFVSSDVDSLKNAIQTMMADERNDKDFEYNREIMIKKYSINEWSLRVVSTLEQILSQK